jgi:hypothetical protein
MRAVVGEHSVAFVLWDGFCNTRCKYNVGTFYRPTGQQFTPQNIAQDVLGVDPNEGMKDVMDLITGLPGELPLWQSPIGTEIYNQFRGEFTDALHTANGEYLYEHLDDAAKAYWGDETCRRHLTEDLEPDPSANFELHDISEPKLFDWELQGVHLASVDGVYEMNATVTPGAPAAHPLGC